MMTPAPDSKSAKRGALLAAFAALQWGATGIFGKLVLDYGITPLAAVLLRVLGSVVPLALGLVVFRPQALKIQRRDVRWFVVYGLMGVAAPYFFYLTAVDLIGAALAMVLVETNTVFIVLLSAIFLRERITRPKVVALALALCGVALVAEVYKPGVFRLNVWGPVAALVAALTTGGRAILVKKITERYTSWTILLYAFSFGALFLAVAQWFFAGLPALAYPPGFWLYLMAMALISTLGANLAYVSALSRIEAGRVSIILTLKSVVAVGLACVIFGETLSPVQWLGAALILAGVWVLRR